MPGLPVGRCPRCRNPRAGLLRSGTCRACLCSRRYATEGRWSAHDKGALRRALSLPSRRAALAAAALATRRSPLACLQQAVRQGWIVPGLPFRPLPPEDLR